MQNQQQKKKVSGYVLDKVIGQGQFGIVYSGYSDKQEFNKLPLAIKQIGIINLNEHQRERFTQEKLNLIKVGSHPNIVNLYDVIVTRNNFYLVMEFCRGGDLTNYVQRFGRKLKEQQVQKIAAQIIQGLNAMYINKVIHRDIKPENLLLSSEEEDAFIKIADLGLSRQLEFDKMAQTICGTPLYSAPEVLEGDDYNHKADL